MRLQQHLTQLGLDVATVVNSLPDHLTLSFEDGVLYLYDQHNPQSKLSVDFIHGALSYRSNQHLGGENLVKACKIKTRSELKLLDATCGLGTDAFLLHCAGFEVTATEQNAVTHALLSDGIKRYQQATNKPCFELLFTPAERIIKNQHFDVIYLDPMFPAKQKSAKNKKAMQLFQTIHQAADDGASQLLNLALESRSLRVVIKRPAKAPLLNLIKPTFQISGKTCRFDVYHQV